jgi:glutamine synthetase
VKKLPMSPARRSTLDKDDVVKSAMPDEMYRVFTHTSATSGRFMATVTEWDLAQYWNYLP